METIYKVGNKTFTNVEDAEKYEIELDEANKKRDKYLEEKKKAWDDVIAKKEIYETAFKEYRNKYSVDISYDDNFNKFITHLLNF